VLRIINQSSSSSLGAHQKESWMQPRMSEWGRVSTFATPRCRMQVLTALEDVKIARHAWALLA
jgi:hypothetical protein